MRLRDDQGNLTEEGRRFFKSNDGANLRQPISDYAAADEDGKRRWIGFARTFAGLEQIPAIKTADGADPTPYALIFAEWGEDIPGSIADVKAIAEKAKARAESLGLDSSESAQVIADFSEEAEEISAFLSEDVKPVVLYELFCADGATTEVPAEGDKPKLIEKVILRTGTWKLRPSPRGPVRRSLKIFRDNAPKGHISLTEIKKNFDKGAIDHVTVPLTHEDKVDENTGYVRNLKIRDNQNGSSDLVAGIEFTEPDIEGKVNRRSIPNVSSGVLFDFVHKQSGKLFKQVLAHVALTNKPWINGMPPFESGVAASDDFNAEEIVSYELSDEDTSFEDDLSLVDTTNKAWDGSASRFTDEQYKRACLIDRGGDGSVKDRCSLPIREPDGAINTNALGAAAAALSGGRGGLKDVSDAQKKSAKSKLKSAYKAAGKEAPANLAEEAGEPPEPPPPASGETVWRPEEGTGWIRSQITQQLRDRRRMQMAVAPTADLPWYSVSDVSGGPTTGKALITCGYGDDQQAWVADWELEDGKVDLDTEDDWISARPEWVAASQTARRQADFAENGYSTAEQAVYDRTYKALIKRKNITPDAAAKAARNAVANFRKGKSASSSSNMSATQRAGRERDLRLSEGRSGGKRTGGHMKLSVDELLSRGVQLSDAEIQDLRHEEEEQEARNKRLEELERQRRRDGSKSLLEQIGSLGFSSPGLEKYVKNVFQDDDGETALTFQDRTDDGRTVGDPKKMTASEIIAGFVDALPKDEKSGKLSFQQQVRQDGDDDKPPLEPVTPPAASFDQPQAVSEEGAEERAAALSQELAASGVEWAREPAGANTNGNGRSQ